MEQFLAICGGIVLAGNVGAVIYKIIKPAIDMGNRVDELERRDRLDYNKLQNLEQFQQTSEKMWMAQCKMLLAIIDHMIDGNHVEEMKKTREHIIELITQE